MADKIITPFFDIPPLAQDSTLPINRFVNGKTLNIGTGNIAFKADKQGIWAGANKFVDAPFKAAMNGDTRVNVLTNKTIFFETITAPAVPADGQLWCADNLTNKKVLWGYFGGDTTNKQQVSMSRMQYSRAFDYTSNQAISVTGLWFQPRIIHFNGFFENTSADKYGITNGQAGVISPLQGYCNSILLDFAQLANVTSDIVLTSSPSVLSCDGLSCYTIPYVSSYTYTNLFIVEQIKIGAITDSLGASSIDKEVYLYVSAWGNTSVTLQLVCPAGWRMAGSFTVIG